MQCFYPASKDEKEDDRFKEFENDLTFFEALGNSPLAKNPFFLRNMGNKFTGNGTEGLEPGKKKFRNIIFPFDIVFKMN